MGSSTCRESLELRSLSLTSTSQNLPWTQSRRSRVERLGHNLVVSFLILSLTMVASSVVMRAVHVYGERHDVPFAVAGLSRTLIRALVYGVGLSILLAFLGMVVGFEDDGVEKQGEEPKDEQQLDTKDDQILGMVLHAGAGL